MTTDGSGTDTDLVSTVLTHTFREHWAMILATLIRNVGDFQLAEDAVQDAFASAVATWHRDGIPDNPAAWIAVAARRRAIDRLRRDRSLVDRVARLAEFARLDQQEHPAMTNVSMDDGAAIDDDRLRLIFTACHPALDMPAQVALTLRVVGGLSTGEIARAFLVAEATMGKRIVRAKHKIAAAHIRYAIPPAAEMPTRLNGVLRVIYLIFNEGYATTEGDALVRADLTTEAIRLGRLLSALMPEEPEVWGLLSLMLLHDARRAGRVDADGGWAALDQQDRSTWDAAMVTDGLAALQRATRLRNPGSYQLQAAITAVHLRAADHDRADWPLIAQLYGALAIVAPSPVVELNRAAAVGFADGPDAGLALIAPLLSDPSMQRYQPLHATHADLLRRRGDVTGAANAYELAIELSGNAVERVELTWRLQTLRASG